MMGFRQSAPDLVSELLEAQKSALLRGDVAFLGKMEAPLEKAFKRLKTEPVQIEDLARIKSSATRNAALLAAAQAGIATARGQIQARGSEDLSVYDANGRSLPTTPGASRLLSRR